MAGSLLSLQVKRSRSREEARLQGATRDSSDGFTLVELLIAVAIIAALSALSFSALSHYRVQSDTLSCANKLRLLAGAAIHFANEHNGLMPSADWSKTGTRTSDMGEKYVVQGSLVPYLGEWKKPGSPSPTEVARCPADNRLHNFKSAWQTYCLNTYAKGVQETTPTGQPVLSIATVYSGRLGAIPALSGMAMFMDGVKPNVAADGGATYPLTINYTTFTARSDSLYVHAGRINVVFMDGHGESFDQPTMRARASAGDTFWSGGVAP